MRTWKSRATLVLLMLPLCSGCAASRTPPEGKALLAGASNDIVRVGIRSIDGGEVLWVRGYELGTRAPVSPGSHRFDVSCTFHFPWGEKILPSGPIPIVAEAGHVYDINGAISRDEASCEVVIYDGDRILYNSETSPERVAANQQRREKTRETAVEFVRLAREGKADGMVALTSPLTIRKEGSERVLEHYTKELLPIFRDASVEWKEHARAITGAGFPGFEFQGEAKGSKATPFYVFVFEEDGRHVVGMISREPMR